LRRFRRLGLLSRLAIQLLVVFLVDFGRVDLERVFLLENAFFQVRNQFRGLRVVGVLQLVDFGFDAKPIIDSVGDVGRLGLGHRLLRLLDADIGLVNGGKFLIKDADTVPLDIQLIFLFF
jgi:hypothetical protein